MLDGSTITLLKQQLAWMGCKSALVGANAFTLGVSAIDDALGGLSRGSLHEILPAAEDDSATATGFALALSRRCAETGPVLWVRQDAIDFQVGRLYAPGIAEFGLCPSQVILVQARDSADTLQAAEEAVRCPAVATVLVETWGRSAALNLTATRRLAFAAGKSGVTALLIRRGAKQEPSTAETRWLVKSAASRPLAANAPGLPVFRLTLLRHRNGMLGRKWIVEWDRDRQSFEEFAPLSRAVAASSSNRTASPIGHFTEVRRAG